MSDTATTVTSLSSAQSTTVRELHEALTVFNASNVLSKEKHWNVVTKFVELQLEFPEMASLARAYYEYEAGEDSTDEPNLDGYNHSLFWLFLSLRAFAKSLNIEDFNKVGTFLQQYLTELSAFSEEFDSQRGVWQVA